MFRGRSHRLHFVGIGGIGMSGIAEVLLNLGYEVSGSDLHLSAITQRLRNAGAKIYQGHQANHIAGSDVVVISSAVPRSNPEVMAARKASIPVIGRAEMLAELMRMKYGVLVAGTHGKTTTTSLVGTLLAHGDLDPTMVIGGKLKSLDSNARLGAGDYLVAEADESDGTFLQLMPTIAVVTNIDAEHLDHWTGGIEQITDAFVDFINKVPFYGAAVLCIDHPRVQGLLPRIDKRYYTYGLSAQADYGAERVEAKNGRMTFDLRRFGDVVRRVELNMVGRHNLLNALAAVAVADEVGVDLEKVAEAFRDFEGISRRFEEKGIVNDILVVDDYGHHPEEIKVTLQAAREAYNRRVVVAFQPHRYTRTRDLLPEFSTCFNLSHVLLIGDVYAAGEEPIDGANSESLVKAVRAHGHQHVRAVGDAPSMLKALCACVEPGDLVLTLGAGSIGDMGEQFLAALSTRPTEESVS